MANNEELVAFTIMRFDSVLFSYSMNEQFFGTVHSTSGKNYGVEIDRSKLYYSKAKKISWLISVDEKVKRKISRGLIISIIYRGLKCSWAEMTRNLLFSIRLVFARCFNFLRYDPIPITIGLLLILSKKFSKFSVNILFLMLYHKRLLEELKVSLTFFVRQTSLGMNSQCGSD